MMVAGMVLRVMILFHRHRCHFVISLSASAGSENSIALDPASSHRHRRRRTRSNPIFSAGCFPPREKSSATAAASRSDQGCY